MTQPEDLDLAIGSEHGLEAPDDDASEQEIPVDPSFDSPVSSDIEAPQWDAIEQARAVQLEDEYR